MTRNNPRSPLHRDDRAVSITVNHVLAIGISTILIVGLLTAAGGLIEDETRQSNRKQLQMIGGGMASQVERVDELARRGADVTVRAEFPNTIAGESYTVSLETGSDCTGPTISTDTCLVLESLGSDVSVIVGVDNDSAVTFDYLGSGTAKITSAPSGTPGDPPLDPNLVNEIGVGDDVWDLPPDVGNETTINSAPIAKFSITPGMAQHRDVVLFDANLSRDPDGSIVEYRWDIGDDGDYDQITTVPVVAIFANESYFGRTKVNLTVVDDDGASDDFNETFRVAGVTLYSKKNQDDITAEDYNGDGTSGGMAIKIQNAHADDVDVGWLFLDPHDDDIDEMEEEIEWSKSEPQWGESEVLITDGSSSKTWVEYDPSHYEEHYCQADGGDGATIYDDGTWFNIERTDRGSGRTDYDDDWHTVCEAKNDGPFDLKDGGIADVTFGEFQDDDSWVDVSDDTVTVGVRYTIPDGDPDTIDPPYTVKWTVNPVYPEVNRENAQFHRETTESQGKVTLKPPLEELSGNVTYDWEIVTNPSGMNITSSDVQRYKGGEEAEVLIDDGGTPVNIDERQYIVIRFTVTDEDGSNEIVYYLDIKPN